MYDFHDDGEDGLTPQERRDDRLFNDIVTACALTILAVGVTIPIYLLWVY